MFGVEVRCYDGKEYHVPGRRVREMAFERYGLDYVTAAGKSVPPCVRTAGHKAQRAFLSALFEGDGWIDKSSTVGLGTASERLAREVQLLLYGLGVPATVSSSYNKKYERDYWTVTVNPASDRRIPRAGGVPVGAAARPGREALPSLAPRSAAHEHPASQRG